MMINKRLINIVQDSKKYIMLNISYQWLSLLANIIIMYMLSKVISSLYLNNIDINKILELMAIVIVAIIVKAICIKQANKMSFKSSKCVKQVLRDKIYRKLLRLGRSYNESINTSEIVQVTSEGVEQLETYFGQYLPQFFYSMLAPITLFIILCFIDIYSALVLLICVPMIPMAIIVVQKWAKKLLSKYWDQYTSLGDTFLENLQGLTTLKIYQADEYKQEKMNEEAENFRKITMKVLTMQLNSITIMDIVAYGGAALGMIVACVQFNRGNIDLQGCLLIILLSADFFLPMRLLGSYFHIAMNGMASSDKIFKLLDLQEKPVNDLKISDDHTIIFKNVNFGYDKDKLVLHDVNMTLDNNKFIAIVGESGCGKSTLANIIMQENTNYEGSITIGSIELNKINQDDLMDKITYISSNSYLFKGSVKDNLLMGKEVGDDKLWEVLDKVNLSAFLQSENGLLTMLNENASNLSGGQRQRLALARALLHDSDIYLFDEATSNIDVESENIIMNMIYELAKYKMVILISHRLANVEKADVIYVMENGYVRESGNHHDLLDNDGLYAKLYHAQKELENYRKEQTNEKK